MKMQSFTTKHVINFENSNVMKDVADESVDLVVTSPPYPMIEMWNELFFKINPKIKTFLDKGQGKDAHDLMLEALNETWVQVHRILKKGGIACINIGDATRKIGNNFQVFPNHAKIIDQFQALGFLILPEILWRKQSTKPNKFMGSGMLPTSAYVTQEHEYILIFRKGESRSFPPKDVMRYKSAYFWEERNVWFSDLWMDLKGIPQKLSNNNVRERSAAYPFELAYRLINMYSVQGDLVLDPFLGTGTTTLASMISGRNSIGYEIDENFQKLIQNGINNIVKFSEKYIQARINNHLKFIQKRIEDNKDIKYESQVHGFKVMTKQEVVIDLKTIKKVQDQPDKNEFVVTYQNLKI